LCRNGFQPDWQHFGCNNSLIERVSFQLITSFLFLFTPDIKYKRECSCSGDLEKNKISKDYIRMLIDIRNKDTQGSAEVYYSMLNYLILTWLYFPKPVINI
jgi:hypothetical protein